MKRRLVAGCWLLVAGAMAGVALLILATPLRAQRPLFTPAVPASEFAERRAAVMRAIGDGVAVLQGATERPVYKQFRHSAQFFYLTGIERAADRAAFDEALDPIPDERIYIRLEKTRSSSPRTATRTCRPSCPTTSTASSG